MEIERTPGAARRRAESGRLRFTLLVVFVALLLWFNVVNLWHLVSHSDVGVLAVFLLVMFHGIVFSGVQFGIAIMSMAETDEDDAGGTRAPEPVAEMVPVPVRRD